jgi:hypothetical protein
VAKKYAQPVFLHKVSQPSWFEAEVKDYVSKILRFYSSCYTCSVMCLFRLNKLQSVCRLRQQVPPKRRNKYSTVYVVQTHTT